VRWSLRSARRAAEARDGARRPARTRAPVHLTRASADGILQQLPGQLGEEQMQAFLNGSYLDHTEAAVPVDDRGFLFADGIYEVIRVYDGRPFLAAEHMRRMRAGLAALRIAEPDVDVEDVAQRLIDVNGVSGDGTIYIQITRGVAPRKHAFPPADVRPTVYVLVKPFTQHADAVFRDGVHAITVPDTRWSRCDVKSIALLPNVLANQQAHEAGAFEALFVRDGVVIEGSHSNLFAVLDGVLITYPASNYILAGITRALVLELAAELGIAATEAPLPWERLNDVSELFLSGTTTEIMPITRVDGRAVGPGGRGPITEQLQRAFRARVDALMRTAVNA
jgi:D-alanine transaminase